MITSYRPNNLPKVRSPQIMASAAGMPCTLRIASFYPGLKCDGPETTVCAHLPIWGKGVSSKVTDLGAAYGCFTCHSILDQPSSSVSKFLEANYAAAVMQRLLCGLTETHAIMVAEGIIVVPDAEIIDRGNWRR